MQMRRELSVAEQVAKARKLGENLANAVLNHAVEDGRFSINLADSNVVAINEHYHADAQKLGLRKRALVGFWCRLLNAGSTLYLNDIINYVIKSAFSAGAIYEVVGKHPNPYFEWDGKVYCPSDPIDLNKAVIGALGNARNLLQKLGEAPTKVEKTA